MPVNLVYPDHVISTHRFQFCPMCATPLTRKVLFDDAIPRVTCPACSWIQLVTNAVGVVVIARSADGIVAIHPPNEAGVGLPAGLVEYGEPPEAAAIREVREETGLDAQIVRCLGWFFEPYPDWPGPMIYFMYEAQIIGGMLKSSEEGTAKIYSLQDFPPVAPGRKGSQMALQTYLAHCSVMYDSNGKSYEIQFPLSAYTFPKEARAERLTFDDDTMHIHLTDGRIVSVPLAWIPTLAHAKPEEREKYFISDDGLVLSWDPDEGEINEDLLVETYLRGGINPYTEEPARVMEQIDTA